MMFLFLPSFCYCCCCLLWSLLFIPFIHSFILLCVLCCAVPLVCFVLFFIFRSILNSWIKKMVILLWRSANLTSSDWENASACASTSTSARTPYPHYILACIRIYLFKRSVGSILSCNSDRFFPRSLSLARSLSLFLFLSSPVVDRCFFPAPLVPFGFWVIFHFWCVHNFCVAMQCLNMHAQVYSRCLCAHSKRFQKVFYRFNALYLHTVSRCVRARVCFRMLWERLSTKKQYTTTISCWQ